LPLLEAPEVVAMPVRPSFAATSHPSWCDTSKCDHDQAAAGHVVHVSKHQVVESGPNDAIGVQLSQGDAPGRVGAPTMDLLAYRFGASSAAAVAVELDLDGARQHLRHVQEAVAVLEAATTITK
jgi:hypothetical protein